MSLIGAMSPPVFAGLDSGRSEPQYPQKRHPFPQMLGGILSSIRTLGFPAIAAFG